MQAKLEEYLEEQAIEEDMARATGKSEPMTFWEAQGYAKDLACSTLNPRASRPEIEL